MSDNPLNAQQLQAVQKQAQDALKVAVESMQLRKWAVEQAFSVVNSLAGSLGPNPPYRFDDKTNTSTLLLPMDPVALAAAVYDFVSHAAVVRVDVSGGGK
jgi:hypothetical protein